MKLFTLAFFLATAAAFADADGDWAVITALRKGPGVPPKDAPEQIVQLARTHLAKQEKALSSFLASHPGDPRRHEAALELAGVTAALGASLSDRNRIEGAINSLAQVERDKTAPAKIRADAAFQRITTTMQTVLIAAHSRPGETSAARRMIHDAAGNFASRYPEDPRSARLLAEAAVLFDDWPQKKRKILEQASLLARDEGTKRRIQDDLRRINLLGQAGTVEFDTVQGGKFSLAAMRGRVVILVFWAGWSPPSVAWLAELAKATRHWPDDRVVIATVSLDRERANCLKTLETLGVPKWPTAFSGRVWDDPVARQLGINALPTVFVYDTEGKLRNLNARENYGALVKKLLSETSGQLMR